MDPLVVVVLPVVAWLVAAVVEVCIPSYLPPKPWWIANCGILNVLLKWLFFVLASVV